MKPPKPTHYVDEVDFSAGMVLCACGWRMKDRKATAEEVKLSYDLHRKSFGLKPSAISENQLRDDTTPAFNVPLDRRGATESPDTTESGPDA